MATEGCQRQRAAAAPTFSQIGVEGVSHFVLSHDRQADCESLAGSEPFSPVLVLVLQHDRAWHSGAITLRLGHLPGQGGYWGEAAVDAERSHARVQPRPSLRAYGCVRFAGGSSASCRP